MSIVTLAVVVVLSFWYLDRALGNWRREQEKTLSDIKGTVDDLYREFHEKFDQDN